MKRRKRSFLSQNQHLSSRFDISMINNGIAIAIAPSTPNHSSNSPMCATTCIMRKGFLLLALAALVKPTSCSSVLDDNPLAPYLQTPLWNLRRPLPVNGQARLHEERVLGITENLFQGSSSSSCQEQCKTLRCEKLCICMRDRRCNEKSRIKEKHRCTKGCKTKVKKWLLKKKRDAKQNQNTAKDSTKVSFGRQFPRSVSVFHSLKSDPIKYSLASFNYNSTVTSYAQCPDLQKDIEAAAALLLNAFIIEQGDDRNIYRYKPRNKDFVDDPVASEIQAESVINEDSYETNTQEEGVDEADIIKSDGTVVFAAYGDEIITWKATDGDILSRTTILSNDEQSKGSRNQISGLLLVNGNLVATITRFTYSYEYDSDAPILAESGGIQLRVYDVSAGSIPTDGTSPLTLLGAKDVRGRYITARAIADIVYVASMSSIDTYNYLTGPLYRYDKKFNGMSDTEYVEAATKYAVELIPRFAMLLIGEIASEAGENCRHVGELAIFASGDEAGDTTNSTNSSRPKLFQEGILKGYFQITTFNVSEYASLGNATHHTTSAFFPEWDAVVYASKDAIVAAGRGWWQNLVNRGWYQSTYFMTFKMDKSGGPAAGWGTGRVPGGIKDQYSMDEQDGFLRIATTSREQIKCIPQDGEKSDDTRIMPWFSCNWKVVANATSQLTILRLPDDENTSMEEVATIENLGLTEEIKSVRFFKDKVFIVTFLRTDPLYAINLTDPENPFVEGELKIRGFSKYMHEYPTDDGSKLLIGVGQDADEKTGRELGLMVSLFNVTELSKPALVRRYIFPIYSYSGAEWDPYGFRFLDESKFLLLPLTMHGKAPFDGFTIMNVTINDIKPLLNVSMAEPGRISDWCWSCTSMPPRSLIFRGQATFVKGHSFKSVDLSASVVAGSEEVQWTNVLDSPNLTKDTCCNYWPMREDVLVLDQEAMP